MNVFRSQPTTLELQERSKHLYSQGRVIPITCLDPLFPNAETDNQKIKKAIERDPSKQGTEILKGPHSLLGKLYVSGEILSYMVEALDRWSVPALVLILEHDGLCAAALRTTTTLEKQELSNICTQLIDAKIGLHVPVTVEPYSQS